MPESAFATQVVRKLVASGYPAYFAGGWVRDYLMNHPSDDIDIATSASVEMIQSLFPKTIPVGVAFGIVIVVEEGHQFEVATFRKEEGYLDGRRPTRIDPATAEEDAKRRDFTINGMFWDPLTDTLYDYVEGKADIEKKVIRAIGDPHQRFLEDRLRMIRAVRYATRFGFTIEPATYQAILSHAASLLPAVAMERIYQEFRKMSQFARFDEALVLLHQLGLLQTIFPELKTVGIAEIQERVQPIGRLPKGTPLIAELLELFPGKSLDALLELCDYLKLSRVDREIATFLHHAQGILSMPMEWQNHLEKIEWATFYASPYAHIALDIARAHHHDISSHQQRQLSLAKSIERIRSKTPIVRAEHLLSLGIVPGKKMGLLLKEAERIQINQEIEEVEGILHLLKNSPLWNT
ncbi:MAG: CCA tRNA nucleotidyltransferase [Verrucomicrobia bacterium]|nr:CCA tRNA nucleotidyltransferase [Verrucomicrobiota bacterium]